MHVCAKGDYCACLLLSTASLRNLNAKYTFLCMSCFRRISLDLAIYLAFFFVQNINLYTLLCVLCCTKKKRAREGWSLLYCIYGNYGFAALVRAPLPPRSGFITLSEFSCPELTILSILDDDGLDPANVHREYQYPWWVLL